MMPVRCFTCGKVLEPKTGEYVKSIYNGADPGETLDKLGLKRYCCRRMVISYINLIDKQLEYQEIQ